MLSTVTERFLKFVPEQMEKEFYAEVYEHYSSSGQWTKVVCLDQNLIEQMSFMFMAILYFHDTHSVIDESMIGNEYEWQYLMQKYPSGQHKIEFMEFRDDVKALLIHQQMTFEENWLFSKYPDEYNLKIYNSPIQSIW